jgi:hypothetical protein
MKWQDELALQASDTEKELINQMLDKGNKTMNYIKQLQAQVKAQDAELISIYESLQDIQRYLSLPKFESDTTVQVSDIFLRINELKHNAEFDSVYITN